MNSDREKWINEVMGSMQGSARAQPDSVLFSDIVRQLHRPEVNVVPLYLLRVAAAAAILLLLLNGFTVGYYLSQDESPTEEVLINQTLVSSYNLYEQ